MHDHLQTSVQGNIRTGVQAPQSADCSNNQDLQLLQANVYALTLQLADVTGNQWMLVEKVLLEGNVLLKSA